VTGAPRLCGLHVGPPGGLAGAATCQVALDNLGDPLGK
jgi:hypothetical protein